MVCRISYKVIRLRWHSSMTNCNVCRCHSNAQRAFHGIMQTNHVLQIFISEFTLRSYYDQWPFLHLRRGDRTKIDWEPLIYALFCKECLFKAVIILPIWKSVKFWQAAYHSSDLKIAGALGAFSLLKFFPLIEYPIFNLQLIFL